MNPLISSGLDAHRGFTALSVNLNRVALLRNDFKRDPTLFAPTVPPRSAAFRRSRSLNSQLIYSYKINPRTALYVGYADGYFGDQEDPLLQTDRTVFFKIGYAWER